MDPRVKSVRPNPDYTLTIVFDNGETRRFDVKPYLEKGVFKELRALKNFNSVKVFLGSIQWRGGTGSLSGYAVYGQRTCFRDLASSAAILKPRRPNAGCRSSKKSMEYNALNSQEKKDIDEKGNFLKPITGKLSSAGIPFMLVGSLAATYHGHPSATMDIDLVVDADEETCAVSPAIRGIDATSVP